MTSVSHNTAFIFSKFSSGNTQAGISRRTGPIPVPRAHEVLVRIHAVSLNYRDFAIVNGFYPVPIKDDVVLGCDLAGEVVALGEGVNEWKIGDRVTAQCDQKHLYGAPDPNSAFSFGLQGFWRWSLKSLRYCFSESFGILRGRYGRTCRRCSARIPSL